MLLRSGSSKQFRDMKTNELIAVNLSCFWRVDRGYDAFPVRAADWYNVSFDIAMEEGDSDQDIATLVRDKDSDYFHLKNPPQYIYILPLLTFSSSYQRF